VLVNATDSNGNDVAVSLQIFVKSAITKRLTPVYNLHMYLFDLEISYSDYQHYVDLCWNSECYAIGTALPKTRFNIP
ncbi:MAG: hypothetical protein WCS40_03370, partial [Methanomethylophilus sp.]